MKTRVFFQELVFLSTFVALLFCGTTTGHATTFDAAAQFSTNANPNGVWSYGYSTTLGGAMTLHTSRGNQAGIDYWLTDLGYQIPGTFFNSGSTTVTNNTGTLVLAPGQLSIHPGAHGEFSVIRFTAPSNGQYQVSGAFTGVDTHGTTTDVHILVNGVIFNGLVNGFGSGSGTAFNLAAALNAGDKIDFAVGWGTNSEFSFDSTGLAAVISTASNAPPVFNPILAGPLTNPANGHVYYLLAPTNWPAAEARAVSLGGHLATINDTNENAWVLATFGGYDETMWIGLNDKAVENTFVWLNGETAAYRNWEAGEPNNGGGYFPNEDGVVMVGPKYAHPGTWYDGPEDQINSAVVEVGPAAPPPPVFNPILAGPLTNPANGHVYYLLAPTNWLAAKTLAISLGGQLATINDTNENTWVYNTLGATNFTLWIGLNDKAVENTFVWLNGETAAYRNWEAGEPNNGGGFFPNEDGVVMVGPSFAHPGTWWDAPEDQIHSAVVEVMLATPPTITSQPQNLSVAIGASATFTVVAFGSSTLDYQWLRNGTNLDGATSASLTLTNTQPADSGTTYSVIVSNAFGSNASSNAVLTVGIGPGITTQPQSAGVAIGSNVTFTVVATGTDPLSFQWRRNGVNVAGATAASLLLTNVQAGIAGTYSVRVTNAFGSIVSSNAVLSVGTAPAFTAQPQSRTVPAGTNVTFVVSATGSATLRYQWRRDGTNIAGATSNSLLLVNVQPANNGVYSVRVTNAIGSIISSNAVLTVTPPITITNPVLAGPITNPANTHVYYLLSPTNWNAAETISISLGGHLATINDTNENTWVYNTFGLTNYTLWVGLNDKAVENTFVWLNGETAAYRNWETGEPNNGGGFFPNEDGVVMVGPSFAHPGTWWDAPEEQIHAAVAEVSITSVPAAASTTNTCPKLTCLPDGCVRVQFAGNAGITYAIQASSNLIHWQNVGAATPDASGNCQFVEPGSAGKPARFYRMVAP